MNGGELAQSASGVPPAIALPPIWWGPLGAHPNVRPITDLIDEQLLSRELAAWLWLLIESGAATLACARPGRTGKSTLLAALTAFLDSRRSLYVVRGQHDPVTVSDPAVTTLLINELSPHLPVYCWGPAAFRALDLTRAGAQLFATVHADTVPELVEQLAAYPTSATSAQMGCFDLVIFLSRRTDGDTVVRRVEHVVSLSVDPKEPVTLAYRMPDDTLELDRRALDLLAGRFGLTGERLARSIAERERRLSG